jgi:hypothetical protein
LGLAAFNIGTLAGVKGTDTSIERIGLQATNVLTGGTTIAAN